jgi:hypothetical protein
MVRFIDIYTNLATRIYGQKSRLSIVRIDLGIKRIEIHVLLVTNPVLTLKFSREYTKFI